MDSFPEIHSDSQLIDLIGEVGFLPLLDSGIPGFSAEEIVGEECRYVASPDGGWDWPLWKWKGPVVTESGCLYGKFFNKKAGFISREWWPDFCNYRRSKNPPPEEGSVEDIILQTLAEHGSLITCDLRAACDFLGKGFRSRFDAYLTRLEMGCYVVISDFVYPRDRHGREYGWGWSLLTTPERVCGSELCPTPHAHGAAHLRFTRTPEASYERLLVHFRRLLPSATDRQLQKLIG